MKKTSLILLIIFLNFFAMHAQHPASKFSTVKRDKFYFGFGSGLVYVGVVGANLSFEPINGLGFMAGSGYYYVNMGYNLGIYYRFLTKSHIRPFVYSMYGHNAYFLKGEKDNALYKGISAGAGVQFIVGKKNNRIWASAQYKFRDNEYENRMKNSFTSDYFIIKPLPVSLSVGFHFPFFTKK